MAIHSYTGSLGYLWHYTFLIICVLVFAMLIVPILIILPLSFNAEPYFTFTEGMLKLDPAAFSTRWYEEVLGINQGISSRGNQWKSAAANSFNIAVQSTLLATSLGTLAAIGLSRPHMPYRRAIMATLISPLIVPIIIAAAGMFFFFSKLGLVYTHLGIVLAHATMGTPYVVITVTSTLVGFDEDLIRASSGLGANPLHTFRKIIFPLVTPGILSGSLFAFISSFDEIVLVYFLAPVDRKTIPIQMWSGLRESLSPSILAVSSLLVMLSVLLLFCVEILRRRNAKLRGMSYG
ncbi:MAG: putative spermidine/putrescine transport system permease protein [Parasphingorhabdus sp.]|jgi:putative spermidine/putrescine transport system permease protein